MHHAWGVIGSVLVVVGALAAVPVPASSTTTGATAEPVAFADSQTDLAADNTTIAVAVDTDGNAEWTVQYRTRLDTPAETETFRRVKRQVEANPLNYTGPFTEQMQEAADVAAAETGRPMTVGNTTVTARETTDGYGVVTYRFEWQRFAVAANGELRIGDALVGFFLGGENTSLVVAWPADRDLERVTPAPDERRAHSVIWRGPTEFAPNEPSVVVTGGFPVPLSPIAVGALALVVVVTGWRLRRGEVSVPPFPGQDEYTDHEPGAGAEADADADDPPEDAVPEALLSDPERVLNLVEENGGRMKQQAVVDRLGWSETKTSQVVTELKEDGELEVYRIGRENVLSLPGEIDV